MTPDVEEKIRNLTRKFMPARIVLTAAELGVFPPLCHTWHDAEALAGACRADLRGLTLLLNALVGLGFLEKSQDTYRCCPELVPYLSSDSPTSMLPILLHQARTWQRWSNLTEIVAPNARIDEDLEAASEQAFIGAMHAIGSSLAPKIIRAFDPGNAMHVLDVAGGSGTYTLAMLEDNPKRTATLFDLPHVIDMARERLNQAGCLDRVTLVAGDFTCDPLPPGHDLALISAIIHQNSPAQNRDLFQKTRAALKPGGRVVIRDHIMSPDLTQPTRGTIFAINMLVATEGGRCYSFDEIEHDLEASGFENIRLIQKDTQMDGLIEAYRPG